MDDTDDMDDMDDIVAEFIVESHENLDRLDGDLVELEKNPNDRERLASIFRIIHTIKGTCGFLGFSKLEAVAHVGENLLSKLRDGKLALNVARTDALLAMFDAVREMLTEIEESGSDGDDGYPELLQRLESVQAEDTPTEPGSEADGSDASPSGGEEAPTAADGREDAPLPMGELLVSKGVVVPEDVDLALLQQRSGDPRHVGEILVERGRLDSAELVDALKTQQAAAKSGGLAQNSIRVDVGLLDNLMNLVGELVLARNQILQFTQRTENSGLTSASQRLNLITTELQESVMKTRMQPIGTVWNKIPRVVRDLASSIGKDVQVVMDGKGTELDKTIIEAIKDPMVHLVRNAVDHGIEPAEARVAAGKPAQGTLSLRAYHEGGHVNIEIGDDGGGIATDVVLKKAVERGLVSPEKAGRMSEREICQLVFLPGFSTAAKVTNVSGRGVGMDVVKTNIEKIGGTIDIVSREGHGATFKIKIPLTLAIIPALMVTSGDDCYAIPRVSLLELVRFDLDEVPRKIETVHGAHVYRLRGDLLPLVYLNDLLGIESPEGGVEAFNIVVLQSNDTPFGLVVDQVNDTEEIVVKPLNRMLKELAVYAGATIMGDGQVALILDVHGLAEKAGVAARTESQAFQGHGGAEATGGGAPSCQSLLIVAASDGRHIAVSLTEVARLEEFPPEMIEMSGDTQVVQYRGQIMPLIRLDDVLGTDGLEEDSGEELVQVVVFTRHGRSVGLVVDRIVDIVAEEIIEERKVDKFGISASAIIQGRVTELIDVEEIIQRHAGVMSEESNMEPVVV